VANRAHTEKGSIGGSTGAKCDIRDCLVTSAKEDMLSSLFVCLSVCLSVCWQLCAETPERICMKLSGNVGNGPMNN